MIAGYVDHLGYLRCVECVDPSTLATEDAEGYPRAVRHDAPPHSEEPCDSCGRVLRSVVS